MQRSLCVLLALTSLFYDFPVHGAPAQTPPQVAPTEPVAPQQPSPNPPVNTAQPTNPDPGQQPPAPGYPPPDPSATPTYAYPPPASPSTAYPPPAPPTDYVVTAPTYPPPQPPPRRKRRGLGLMISGWSIFGATYLVTAAVGTSFLDSDCSGSSSIRNCQRFGGYLLIPVVGPLASMAETSSASGRFGLFLPFLTQSAGLAMGIAGAVLFARSKRANQLVNADGFRVAKGLRINAGPTTVFNGGQLQLNYRF